MTKFRLRLFYLADQVKIKEISNKNINRSKKESADFAKAFKIGKKNASPAAALHRLKGSKFLTFCYIRDQFRSRSTICGTS